MTHDDAAKYEGLIDAVAHEVASDMDIDNMHSFIIETLREDYMDLSVDEFLSSVEAIYPDLLEAHT